MWQAFGEVLPLAVAVALSTVPFTAMVLVMLSPTRSRSAPAFLAGWVIGMVLVLTVAILGATALPEPRRRQADLLAAVPEVIIGMALVGLALSTWRRRRAIEGKEATDGGPHVTADLPRWLQSVSSSGPLGSFGIALALNVRPKALLLAIAAGLDLRAASLDPDQIVFMILLYTAIGASTVVVPIVATLMAPRRWEPRLVIARDWLSHNGWVVASLILFMVGIWVVAHGLTRI